MPLVAGGSFGHFRILACVGRGGMGEVYRAEDTSLHRVVALKTIRPDLLAGASATDAARDIARFEREARVLASFSHPNVVTLFAFERIEGIHTLVMEWVDGSTVHHLLRQPTALADRMRWIRESGAALAALHRAGIVHRDFKPANMIVDGVGRVRLLDFGLARVFEREPDVARLTATHDVVGTPKYMAPEQRVGANVDGRADQFAWGLVAYELLTGRHPRDLLPHDLRDHFPAAPPPPPRTLDTRISEQLSRTLLRTLSPDAGDRFATMDAALADLDPAPTPDDPAPDTERASPEPRLVGRPNAPATRASRGLVFFSSAALVLAAGALGALVLWRSAPASHPVRVAPSSGVSTQAPPTTAAAVSASAATAAPEPGPSVSGSASVVAVRRPPAVGPMAYRTLVLTRVRPDPDRAAFQEWFAKHGVRALRCFQDAPPQRACADSAVITLNCEVLDGQLTQCTNGTFVWKRDAPHGCTLSESARTCVEGAFNGQRLPTALARERSLVLELHPVE